MMEGVQLFKLPLVSMGNDATQEAQCWSLLLARWALSKSEKQVSLGDTKCMLSIP